MEVQIEKVSTKVGNHQLVIETGKFAARANAAVVVRYGETQVLATVVSSEPREDLDYFPLSVEYKEKYYAGGRISPSRFVKRERRPSDANIIIARLVDRSLRPLFPKEFKDETQIITTVLSYDEENDPDIVAVVAASATLSLSDLPWQGPIGCVRVGAEIDERGEVKKFLLNPTNEQRESSKLDLVVSSASEAVVMVEAASLPIPEDQYLEAIKMAHEHNQLIIEKIKELTAKVGRTKVPLVVSELFPELKNAVEKYPQKKVDEAIETAVKLEGGEMLESLVEEISHTLGESYSKTQIQNLLRERIKRRVREKIIDGKRPDGRSPEEIRPLNIEVGVLPRTHGSAVFQRGETQVLTVVTLGAPSLEQWMEGMMGEETKRFIHHYYAPPYCYGEVGRLGFPSRREVGHGALAERALVTAIPGEDAFPYTIRVVSEVMSSNGSTSMASVCGSTLALMDAGVPVNYVVAGVALGLVKEAKKEVILTDIIGLEDFNGDMDLKVAGGESGITAIQLDIKISGITIDTLQKAFKRAKEARLEILKKMLRVIDAPRSEISRYAPKIHVIHVKPEVIGEIIGPGGRVIREIIAKTGANIDVNDEGRVVISAATPEEAGAAKKWIEDLTLVVEPGDQFTGTVERIEPYGVFVKMGSGKEGLVHVSEMSSQYISDPSELVCIGDQVEVWVKGFNERGQISLTMISEEEKRDRDRLRARDKRPERSPEGRRSSKRMGNSSKRGGIRDHYREALESKRR